MMQIIIDIDENDYKVFVRQRCNDSTPICRLYKAIKNGTVIQKGHGRLIDGDLLLKEMENGIKSGLCYEGYEEYQHINDMDDCVECVMYSDTIIPADMGGNE